MLLFAEFVGVGHVLGGLHGLGDEAVGMGPAVTRTSLGLFQPNLFLANNTYLHGTSSS